jgi:hypothetical protein
MKISSKNTGKSGGAKIEQTRITLMDIYDKSDKENLTDKELDDLLKQAPE